MGLLKPGYWPTTYWSESYWHELYWQIMLPILATISGEAIIIRRDSLNIQNRIEERSIASFTVVDRTGTASYQRGEPVVLRDLSGNLLFQGFIGTSKEKRFGPNHAGLYHTIKCMDWHYLADKRVCAESYLDTSCGVVVQNLIDNYLVEEGIIGGELGVRFTAGVATSNIEFVDPYDATNVWWGFFTFKLDEDFSIASADDQYLSGKYDDANNHLEVYLGSVDGKLHLRHTEVGAAEVALSLEATWTAGQWYSVLVQCSTVSGQKVVIDAGIPVLEAGNTTAISLTADMCIGSRDNGVATDGIAGIISELAMGNVVLTAAEEYGIFGGTMPASAVNIFMLNEGVGTIAHDTGTGLDNGTLDTGCSWTVVTERIQEGLNLETIALNYVRVSDAIDSLAEASNFIWYIDVNRRLWFVERSTTPSPRAITTDEIMKGSTTLTRGSNKYRNTQYLRGGKGVTDLQTEAQLGDGDKTAFPVGYPVAKEPTIRTDIGAGYVARTVGIKGVETGFDWYWSKGDPIITQDVGGVVLTAAHKIEVAYYGQYEIIVLAEDGASITDQLAIEGIGTGKVEMITDRTNITDSDTGINYALALLKRFTSEADVYKFKTKTGGLEVGQNGPVTDAKYGLAAEDMLFESIMIRLVDREFYYDVQAIVGPETGSWQKFFRDLKNREVPTGIDIGTGVLIILKTTETDWEWETECEYFEYTCDVPGVTLWPELTRYPC